MGIFNKSGGKNVTQSQQQQILGAIRVQKAAWGGVMPVGWGQGRLPGIIIDYTDFKPVPHTSTTSTGGKGGGHQTQTSTTYTYSAAVVIGLCWGPIQGIKQIWPSSGTLPVGQNSETFSIPSGGGSFTITPPDGGTFTADDGVYCATAYSQTIDDFGSDGSDTLTGTQNIPFAKVTGTPATGQYKLSGSTYTFAAADIGKVATINYSYSVPTTNSTTGNPLSIQGLTILTGAKGQGVWSYMTSAHPGTTHAIGYTLTAGVATPNMDLGTDATPPNDTYEVQFGTQFGGGIVDANPRDIVNDAITNPFWGTTFPSANLGDLTAFSNYCVANGIFLSPIIDTQTACNDFITQISTLTNTGVFWSEGKLKFVPYGDQSTVGNGATFIANTTPIYDLTLRDFLNTQNDPVTIAITEVDEQYNVTGLEVLDRSNGYNPTVVQDMDDSAVEVNGQIPASVLSAHEICSQAIGRTVAMAINRRTCNIVRQFTFTLGLKYLLLEPMDLVTLTVDGRNDLQRLPVRIIQKDEDESGNLIFTAEEFPFGSATTTLYPTQTTTSFTHNTTADPGLVNTPIIFEANDRFAQFAGNTLVIGVSGSDPNYGGCQAWVSQDGTSFKQIDNGRLYGSSRQGTLSASLASSPDPDTTHTLSVDLSESLGILTSGSVADADNFVTLCFVDGELLSYETATPTGSFQYNLGTRLRRGVYNSVIGTHAIGSNFLRLDNAVLQFQYDPTWAGKTIFFKFTAFNSYGNMEQSLSEVTAYSFTIPGAAKGAVDASTGVFIASQYSAGITVDNSSFEASVVIPPPGWKNVSSTLSYDTSTQQSGTRSLVVSNNGGGNGAVSARTYKVVPGEQYKIDGYAKRVSGTGTAVIAIAMFDSSNTFLSSISGSTTSSSWTRITTSGTVPTNAASAQIQLVITGSGANVSEFDNILALRVSSADDEISDGTTKYVPRSGITTGTDASVYNPSFETFPDTASVAEGWTANFDTTGTGTSFSRGTGFVGNYSQTITNNGASGGTSIASRPFSVKPNARYTFGVRAKSSAANPGSMYFRALWFANDSDFSNSANIGLNDIVSAGGPTASNTWQLFGNAPQQVDLSAAFNTIAMYSDGHSFTTGHGIISINDFGFSATLMGSQFTFNNALFQLGTADANNGVICGGQTITLPSGNFATFRMIGSAISSASGQLSQSFQVNYTDGTHDTFTQSFSDWTIRASFSGETVAYTMPYLNGTGGSHSSFNVFINEYEFTLNAAKSVSSIVLPSNGLVVLLAMTLVPSGSGIVAPAKAKFARIILYNWVGTSSTISFDTVTAQLASLNPADGVVTANGTLSPSVLAGSFSFTHDTSSYTWSWSGLVIARSDGTSRGISDGSQANTSLTSGTTYLGYPFWDDTANTLGWVSGGHGAQGFSFLTTERSNMLSQLQNLFQRISLSSGPLTASTTTSGSGSGGGGFGGSGSCVRHTMLVEERTKGIIPAWSLEVGDWIRTNEGGGWTKVVYVQQMPQDVFIRVTVNGKSVEVTPNHPFTAMDEDCKPIDMMYAAKLSCLTQLYVRGGADFVEGIQVIRDPNGYKMKIACENIHTFFSGEEEPYILTHNLLVEGT